MADTEQALPRCMGGRWCRHAPGACTATAPPQLGEPFTAVALPAPARDPEDERRARAIAFGLYALDAPLGASVHRGWDQLELTLRELYLARARLVLVVLLGLIVAADPRVHAGTVRIARLDGSTWEAVALTGPVTLQPMLEYLAADYAVRHDLPDTTLTVAFRPTRAMARLLFGWAATADRTAIRSATRRRYAARRRRPR